ncbi:MAG: hypothetical protein DRP68_03325 [Candidatus Omnitrophota bacterium]|nr:MAG: hypothetical protein DRP68_03325 [Candidatus Omnitrophota bacterium]RKY39325.1 MAG: hypothetical protein DRP72_00155 [Candidatus Omnitrophota bacterium]
MLKGKIKVVHLVDVLKVGGLEKTLAIIVRNLDPKRYQVNVWCLIEKGEIGNELVDKGIEVEVLHCSSQAKLKGIRKLIRKLKRDNVDIIHCWGVSGGVWGRVSSVFAGTPIRILHVENIYYDFNMKQRTTEYILSFFTDRIIACAEVVKKCLVEFIGINERRVEVIYNSAEDVDDTQKKKDDSLLSEFRLTKEDTIVSTVARLVPVKGHKYLLEVASKIVKKYPRVKFLIIGEGPLKEELIEMTERLNIENNVIFTGLRKDVARLLGITDILVQPSIEKEGLPLAIIEAQRQFIPIIATDIGGNREAVINKVTGLLVPPKDTTALLDSLIFLLENPQIARQLGEKGREIYNKRFSSTIMINKIEALYQSLVREKCAKKLEYFL